MGALTNTSLAQSGAFTPTKLSLSASDTLTYTSGQNQILILYNTTGTPVVATVTGSTATTVPVATAGSATFSVASGLAVTVPANGYKMLRLDTISGYLSGNITITGGTGCDAVIVY